MLSSKLERCPLISIRYVSLLQLPPYGVNSFHFSRYASVDSSSTIEEGHDFEGIFNFSVWTDPVLANKMKMGILVNGYTGKMLISNLDFLAKDILPISMKTITNNLSKFCALTTCVISIRNLE